MNQIDILNAIVNERKRQDILHPRTKKDNQLAILTEEYLEVVKALQGEGDLKEELVHLAAYSMRWLEGL